jgi:hypothetical protein
LLLAPAFVMRYTLPMAIVGIVVARLFIWH